MTKGSRLPPAATFVDWVFVPTSQLAQDLCHGESVSEDGVLHDLMELQELLRLEEESEENVLKRELHLDPLLEGDRHKAENELEEVLLAFWGEVEGLFEWVDDIVVDLFHPHETFS